MDSQQTKRALVTGGNRGIGFAISKGLLAAGYEVIITARSLEGAQQAASKLGDGVMSIALDVSDDDSIETAAKKLTQDIDYLDVLVNNAGVYPDKNIDVLTISRDVLETALQTNTLGVIQMVQRFLPLLEASPEARVINVSSGMGSLNGLTNTAPSYCLSKLALNGATIMLSQSLQSKGIAVNSVGPGWVKTDMGGSSAPRTPEQGADTVIWLATEAPYKETGKFWRDRAVISF
ncbi:MAG: SDR family NAD(P)-dependent oxidoreductase [Cyanobacteria bacterium P01_D01_bin.6]